MDVMNEQEQKLYDKVIQLIDKAPVIELTGASYFITLIYPSPSYMISKPIECKISFVFHSSYLDVFMEDNHIGILPKSICEDIKERLYKRTQAIEIQKKSDLLDTFYSL